MIYHTRFLVLVRNLIQLDVPLCEVAIPTSRTKSFVGRTRNSLLKTPGGMQITVQKAMISLELLAVSTYTKLNTTGKLNSIVLFQHLVICSRFINCVSFAESKNVAIPKPGTACTSKITFPVKVLYEFTFI